MKKWFKLFSALSLIIGALLLFSSQTGLTGAVIGIERAGSIGSILGLVLIIGGILVMMAGGLEKNLGKYLAEIEVLTEEIRNRAKEKVGKKNNFYSFLEGIVSEARILEDSSRKARNALKKEKNTANRYVGEFALSAKNLADNLNQFVQTLYGNSKADLKKLKINIENAPKINENKNLYDLITGVHNYSEYNPLIVARNLKGHGKGHEILKTDSNLNALSWVNQTTNDYLNMTATCLKTIADKDKDNLKEKKDNRNVKLIKKRVSNFVNRYKKPVLGLTASAALAAGLVGGVVGNQSWQNYQEKEKLKEKLIALDFAKSIDAGITTMNPELGKMDKIVANERNKSNINRLIKEHLNYWGEIYLNKENPYVQKYLEEHPDALKKKSEFEKVNRIDKEQLNRIISVQKYLAEYPDALKKKSEIEKMIEKVYRKKEK
ncbi:MAG: hypothetical protein AABX88_02810 [Nanoarchaeota archaeon]